MNIKTIAALMVAMVAIIGVVAVAGGDENISAEPVTTQAEVQSILNEGGTATLTSDLQLTERLVVPTGQSAVLDFNGYIMDYALDSTDSYFIQVDGTLLITDSSADQSGGIVTTGPYGIIIINSGGELTIDSGNIIRDCDVNRNMIVQYGSCHITGGNFVLQGIVDPYYAPSIVTTYGGGHTTIDGGTFYSDVYAFVVLGNGTYDTVEDLAYTTLEVNDCQVDAGVSIGTNASGGLYSGFTIGVNGGTFTGSFGIYCSGYGIYNLTGGTFTNDNGCIQMASGILNIGGDVVLKCDVDSNAPGLTAGQIDGNGVLVVGKASNGYVRGIEINITGGTLSNDLGDAIVIYDSSLGDPIFDDYGVDINLIGGSIEGDIKLVQKETSQASDSSKLSLSIDGSNVVGNISMDEGMESEVSMVSGTFTGDTAGLELPSPSGTVTYPDGITTTYYGGSFLMPGVPSERDGYTFLGYSLSANSTAAQYSANQRVINISGNVTVYEVWHDDSPAVPPLVWEDDDYAPTYPSTETDDSDDDDTVTIVACAAAAVVAALMAVYLVVERKG